MSSKGLKLKYFVLKPESNKDFGFEGSHKPEIYAKASRKAMWTYAKVIENENPELAKEIREWVEIINKCVTNNLLDRKSRTETIKKQAKEGLARMSKEGRKLFSRRDGR